MKAKQETLVKVKVENEEEKLEKYKGFELRTKSGFRLDEIVSGLQKAIRRGQEERALFFMEEMIEANFVKYFWRRISIIVLEDIGLADAFAPVLINSLAQANERLNTKEIKDTYYPGMAVLYMCRAKKSREVDYALDWIDRNRSLRLKIEPNDVDLDCHTHIGRQRLRQLSQNTGKSYEQLVDEKFYYEGILSNKSTTVKGDKWKRKVWEMRKLDKKKMNLKYEENN